MVKYNINDYIYIQINIRGWEHLKHTVGDDYIKHCIKAKGYEMVINDEIWYRLEIHEVASIMDISVHIKQSIMFDDSEKETPKKPIGLIPRDVHEQSVKTNRFNDVCEAISKYYTDGLVIPTVWLEEYNDLTKELNPIYKNVIQ